MNLFIPYTFFVNTTKNMKGSPFVACLLVILFTYKAADCQQCTHEDIRLVGGSGDYEGNVQVCINGTWGYVCDNNWSSNDAKVVCRQLGYSTSYAIYRYSSYYGYGNGTIWMDRMYCTGYENKLVNCSTGVDIGAISCDYNEMAGVYCPFTGTLSCSHGDIRLATFHNVYYGRSEGRVEVCYNGEWGTVCANGWGNTDATVVCKQLGYQGYINYFTYHYYGYGYGSIWLDDISCYFWHSSLFSCSYSLVTTDCSHYNDASVRCYSRDTSLCTNGDVKLWSAYDSIPDNEGIVLVCKSGTWYPVYEYSNCRAAEIACKAAGHSKLEFYRYNGGKFYGYYYKGHYRYTCANSASNLSECSEIYYSQSYTWDDSLGIRCQSIEISCSNGDIRLADGEINTEGRVEYCYNGEWVPMCSLSSYTASLICKHLGFTKWSTVIKNEIFKRNDVITTFQYLQCSSSHTNLSQCSIILKTSCNPRPFVCSTHYGLKCYDDLILNQCTNGDVRLVDGTIEQEGRPEVCVDGIWGSICDDGWSLNDAYVTCVSLGYVGTADPTVHYNSQFGSGLNSVPIVWNNVNCNHWNKDTHDCIKVVYPQFTCSFDDVAGVRCTEGCSDGDTRLVGSNSANEGTVEVCYDELWGLISDDGWTDNEATVVCNQLGYNNDRGVVKAVLKSSYAKPNKTIHLTNVDCSGNEFKLSDCSFNQLSLEEGKLFLKNTSVAGVHCSHVEPLCSINHDDFESCEESKESVRLMNNGIESKSKGRVEYCNGQYWTPLCTMDNRAAAVICGQIRHTQYTWATIFHKEVTDDTIDYSLVQNITCNSDEKSISQCSIFEDGKCQKCSDNYNIVVKCHDSNESCNEGSVRLVNGSTVDKGRVEVCVNEIWGSVCDEGWDSTDGHVVCHQLGYERQEPSVFLNSFYGDGDSPIVYSNVQCKGWEDSISDCVKDGYFDYTCSPGHVAGLQCNGNSRSDAQTGGSSADSSTIVGSVLGSVIGLILIVIVAIVVILALAFRYLKQMTMNDENQNPNIEIPTMKEAPIYEDMDNGAYENNPRYKT